jgi:HTH-type transcriptional regulator/antitoxin HigA
MKSTHQQFRSNALNIKPIRDKDSYEQALTSIENLWDAQPDSPEADRLDVLVTLVESYEQQRFPIEAPDPIEAIKFRMEQQGLSDADLVPYLGQRSRVSEILNKKRKLTLTMIRNLHQKLNIPLESLVSDYGLNR